MNYFPQGNPDAYSTDYDDFTCDHATGLETQAKFADTIYSRDARGVFVNLFIPSRVACADHGVTLRQVTGIPDDPVTTIEVTSDAAPMTLRVRFPSWTAGTPRVRLNGAPVPSNVVSSGWVVLDRYWRQGDRLEVTLPMRLGFSPAPDQSSVQAITYGPVVLAGAYGARAAAAMRQLDTATVRRTARQPMTFQATADGEPVTLIPVARAQHQLYSVYWQTGSAGKGG